MRKKFKPTTSDLRVLMEFKAIVKEYIKLKRLAGEN